MIIKGNLKVHFAPLVEFDQPLCAELLKTTACLLYGLFCIETCLGEKLVGKTDYLLLYAYGLHVAMGEGEVLACYLL